MARSALPLRLVFPPSSRRPTAPGQRRLAEAIAQVTPPAPAEVSASERGHTSQQHDRSGRSSCGGASNRLKFADRLVRERGQSGWTAGNDRAGQADGGCFSQREGRSEWRKFDRVSGKIKL